MKIQDCKVGQKISNGIFIVKIIEVAKDSIIIDFCGGAEATLVERVLYAWKLEEILND